MHAYDSMRLFLHLSRTLHFGRTSRECNVSPSALSRAIQRLEQELGVALFVRDRRNVELTPDGVRFQTYVTDALDRYDEFSSRLRSGDRVQGTLSLFCTVTASQSVLPAILTEFRESHPDVHIQIETGYAGSALEVLDEPKSLDVTIAALPDPLPAGLVSRLVALTPLLFVAPDMPCPVSRAAARKRLRWDEIPLILPTFGLARNYAATWFRERGIDPIVHSESPSHEAIISLVSLGCGVGVVPELVLESSALRGRVRVLDVRPPLPTFRIGVCAKRRKLSSPVVAAFWEAVARAGPAAGLTP